MKTCHGVRPYLWWDWRLAEAAPASGAFSSAALQGRRSTSLHDKTIYTDARQNPGLYLQQMWMQSWKTLIRLRSGHPELIKIEKFHRFWHKSHWCFRLVVTTKLFFYFALEVFSSQSNTYRQAKVADPAAWPEKYPKCNSPSNRFTMTLCIFSRAHVHGSGPPPEGRMQRLKAAGRRSALGASKDQSAFAIRTPTVLSPGDFVVSVFHPCTELWHVHL